MHAQRQTSGGGWTTDRPDSESPPRNEDKLCYGAPVYALADGEVLSAWRMAPDNARPGVKDPRNNSEGGTGISLSGNHVSVLADDGSVIIYSHLAPATVPRGLCREPDKAIMDNADDRVLGNVVDGVATINLPAESAWTSSVGRPQVVQGQMLGRVGNSGNSSGPHIHLKQSTNADVSMPFTHDRAWRSTKSNPGAWEPFTGQVLGPTDKATVVHASPLLRRGEGSGGGVGEVALRFVRSRRAVAALRGATGDLKLITWGMSTSGELVRRGEISAGGASAIAIAEPRSDLIVTALRDAAGDLRLISWLVKDNGELERC
ncbi:MAG TPA: M23 family metallopeptidase, partial [Arachnia sp.]|nr:M23 family metallopeptidase [Arachnia sp.]